jgi:hypothetical protein
VRKGGDRKKGKENLIMQRTFLAVLMGVFLVVFTSAFVRAAGDAAAPVTSQEEEKFLGKWEGQWNASVSSSTVDIHYKDQKIVVVFSFKTTGYKESNEFVPEFSRDSRGVVMSFTRGRGYPYFEFWLDGVNLLGQRKYAGRPTYTITMKPTKK